jgi:hypothetical protein
MKWALDEPTSHLGRATCGSDLVSDTPSHNTANYGVPAYPHYSTCTGTPVEMTMNYMDYTDDEACICLLMDKKSRMDALFVSGGPRLLSESNFQLK